MKNEHRRATRNARRAEELDWERAHPGPVAPERFQKEVVPKLQALTARAIARATGLSVSYCAQVKRGERVPHPRWWDVMDHAPRGV